MKTLKFKCTGCGGDRLEEICSCNRIVSRVASVSLLDSGSVDIAYGKIKLDGDEIPIYEYRCADCKRSVIKGKYDGQQISADDLAKLFE